MKAIVSWFGAIAVILDPSSGLIWLMRETEDWEPVDAAGLRMDMLFDGLEPEELEIQEVFPFSDLKAKLMLADHGRDIVSLILSSIDPTHRLDYRRKWVATVLSQWTDEISDWVHNEVLNRGAISRDFVTLDAVPEDGPVREIVDLMLRQSEKKA